MLHRTRTPLTIWFWAAYLMITDKRGLSALALQRQLGVARYETAWMLLHKLRRATVNANRARLAGEIEVDEAWIGGPQEGITGRMRLGRFAALAVFAVELSNPASAAGSHASIYGRGSGVWDRATLRPRR